MFPCFVLTGQIWQILTLVSCCSPQQAEGVIWAHAHPKAFVQLRNVTFFSLFSDFPLSEKQYMEYLGKPGCQKQPACSHEAFFLV